MKWYEEEIRQGYSHRFEVTKVVHREKTAFQDMLIFDTAFFGRILVLDDIVQTTERDEFIYHEMLAHVPMFAHGGTERVLIIGGGDGGALREVLRHPVERATMVDIDKRVVDLCKQHLPSLSSGAFDDPRTTLLIDDGIKFIADTDETFDAIMVDSTDRTQQDGVGPGEVLFTEAFYADCKRRLTPGGVLITQNDVPFYEEEEVINAYKELKPHFADVSFYVIAVPSFVGGFMAFGWATDDRGLRRQPEALLAERYNAAGLATRYYSPSVHKAAFALPPYISRLLD